MARDIIQNPPKFKTRFSASAHLYQPSEGDVQEVHASLDRLKALMPGDIDPAEHPTLLYIVGNLFVAGLVNMNDDAVSIDDGIRICKGFEWQQINLEHNRGEVRGFVLKAGFSELGTDRIITEEEARAAAQPVNIAIVVALWKITDKDLANYILQSAAPGSPTKDDLSFSFEVGFDDYSVVVLPKGASNLALATQTIASSSPDFPYWDKTLRVHKGSGHTKAGSRVARVLVGEILPLGGGIVAIPAAAVKGLVPITESPVLEVAWDGEDAATDAKTGVSYDSSSTQCTLSAADAAPFLAFAAGIPEEQLYTAEEGHGRENESHITVRYGIVGTDHAPLTAALKDCGSAVVTFGKVSSFENADKPYDVLMVEVMSDDLHHLRALVQTSCECEFTYPEYNGHLTLAYLKKGLAKQYIGDARFEGLILSFDSITFSPHTGARVEIPLTTPAPSQNAATQVYSTLDTVITTEDPHDLMSASTTLSRHLKLSPGWQEKLAALQTQAGGDPLPQGVDVTLSDGRKLKGLKIFDGSTLELDKETSFHGVIITDMTPGVPPQADDSKAIHPRLGDVYPNKRPEKMAEDEAARAEQERAQKAAYTDAALAFEQALAKLSALFTFLTQNVAVAGVSTSIPQSMTLDDLKTLQASVQSSDKLEDLKTAFANVALFAEEIAKASEQMALARKAAEETAATSKTSLDEVKAQLATLAAQHNELVAAQAAAAAEQLYQERMASVSEAFVFDDETRAEIVSEIKACADDAAFVKWMARAKKLYKGWLKAEMAPPFEKKDGDKEKKEKEEEEECAKAAQIALASAAAAIVDPAVTNSLDLDASKTLSLKEKFMAVASKNIRIGGKTVESLSQEATAARKTR